MYMYMYMVKKSHENARRARPLPPPKSASEHMPTPSSVNSVFSNDAIRGVMGAVRGDARHGSEFKLQFQPAQFGRLRGSNFRIALVGRPNAGCSTLFNALTLRRTPASCFLAETRTPATGRTRHETEGFSWLRDLYAPRRERPVTYAVTDAPARACQFLSCPREDCERQIDAPGLSPLPECDDDSVWARLWPGAGAADVVIIVLRNFEGLKRRRDLPRRC